ncbi:hypothetical protein [Azospirillum sp. TSH100]|uniref:hypothetical protein n=1 Tax=Azospirillum sp. TSH100 TaxID=652764 RepID=UPI0010AB1293|nr:hypothetical protein [Azospirillum sp. TSH100]QCG92196.1 hypothetical protein E6C72_30890 [Azospirillum sp. TSH100]
MTRRKPVGLFVNTEKANCSIYESGLMVYRALAQGSDWTLDYAEIHQLDIAALHDLRLEAKPGTGLSLKPAGAYDFWVFNYHHLTMRGAALLDSGRLRPLGGLKFCIVLEVARDDAFVHAPRGDFDGYLVLDPTIGDTDPAVHPFPRPLEAVTPSARPVEAGLPVIGSFGFGTPGKGFEIVVDAVNREFDRAVIRINIPPATYADEYFFGLHGRNYAEYLGDLCRKVAKPGIEVRVSHRFFTKEELVEWCAGNTLNCFMYTRNQPGLAATTDQAVATGRPLAVSTNDTFRHLHRYVTPYPYRSLRDSIALSGAEVQRMRRDWAPDRNVTAFRNILADHGLLDRSPVSVGMSGGSELSGSPLPGGTGTRMSRKLSHSLAALRRPRVLLLDICDDGSPLEGLGGHAIDFMRHSDRFTFLHARCTRLATLPAILRAQQDLDAIVVDAGLSRNIQPLAGILSAVVGVHRFGCWHGRIEALAGWPLLRGLDHVLVTGGIPDPWNGSLSHIGRMVPDLTNVKLPPSDRMRVGGVLADADPGAIRRIVEMVRDLGPCEIALLPILDETAMGQVEAALDGVRPSAKAAGITLDLLPRPGSAAELCDVFATNSMNVFIHGTEHDERLARCMDLALSVQRPLATTVDGAGRRFAGSPLALGERSLAAIARGDLSGLAPFCNDWSVGRFRMRLEAALSPRFGWPGHDLHVPSAG